MSQHESINSSRLPGVRWASTGLIASLGLFAVALIAALAWEGGVDRFYYALLVNACFFASISLGAFFVLLQHLTKSEWSVVVRRIAEVFAAALPAVLLLFAPLLLTLLLGDGRLYSWNDEQVRATDELVKGKAPYLNAPFFVARSVFYFIAWSAIATFYWRQSVGQDRDLQANREPNGELPARVVRQERLAGPAMIVFAFTICFAAFDWLMTLDPHWFSTIFGVYYFAGAATGFAAVLTLATASLEKSGVLRGMVTREHYHDLGKQMFGFLFFWAYIAFSQYLLIWYANIPEETGWYQVRQSGGWQWISLALIAGHFFLPFFALMPREWKRRRSHLVAVATWLLAMHWLDLYWLAMPRLSPADPAPTLIDLVVSLACLAFYGSIVTRAARQCSLVATGDPRLSRSLAFHNTY